MRKILKFTFILFPLSSLIWLGNACTPEVSCQSGDTIDGIIDSTYNLGMCYQYMEDTTYTISDIIDFQNLRGRMDSLFLSKNTGCDTIILISPDFNKETLLGCFAEGSGCDASFHRTVFKDEAQKKYTYTIEIEDCGNCNYRIPSMNWVLVPKIPDSYTVEFKVLHKPKTSKTQ